MFLAKPFAKTTVAVGGAALMAFSVAARADDAINIPTHNWSSQLVGAEIVGKLFEKVGEEVNYVPVDSSAVYQSMCENDIDIVHEVWQGAFGPAFEKVVDEGCVIDLVTHDAKTREEWWYPIHVEKHCPGLPDWRALRDCSAKFARADSNGKGVYLAGSASWVKHYPEMVDALDLNFILKNVEGAAHWAELDAAVKQDKPIVLFNWTPNFIEALYEGKFVEFPTHHADCFDDASWGVNPNAKYDCGNPKDGYLKIGVSHDFKNEHPKAFAVAQKINFTNLDIAQQSNYVDTDGMEVTEAADRWLEENEARWKQWLN